MIARRLVLAVVCGAACLAPPSALAENFVVTVTNQSTFDPSEVTIHVGDTVTFQKGATAMPHNVHADGHDDVCAFGPTCFRCGADGACSGGGEVIGAPTTDPFTVTLSFFDQPGTFPYFCQPHGAPGGVGMAGRIVVLEKPGALAHGKIRFTNASYNRAETVGATAIQVERTDGDDGAVGVSFGTSNGSAVAGQDYAATSGMLSWADGESGVKTFNVAITNDAAGESNETVDLHLTSPTGGAALGSPASATLTIVDDDGVGSNGAIAFTSASWSVAETASLATVTVGRTGNAQMPASVDYTLSNGTATAGQDYTMIGGTLDWAGGDTAAKSFQVPILDDIADEGSETLSVSLSHPVNAALGSPSVATVTIFDNEAVPPCEDGPSQVCLLDRFLARIHFATSGGQSGDARAVKLTDSASAFEFFEPGNVEIVVKMKDACGFAPGNPIRNFWPFIAGLTNVRAEVTIIDTKSGLVRSFFNALGQPFFTPATDSPDGKTNPPGAIQATTEAQGAFPTCDL